MFEAERLRIEVHTGDGETICRNDDWTLYVEGVAIMDEDGFRNPEGPTVLQAAILAMAEREKRMREALREAEVWLTSALECERWVWDIEQYEAATEARDKARALGEGK